MAIVADSKTILDAAAELWAEQETLQRDEVDGFFYWRFCRPEFKESVEVAVEKFNDNADIETSLALYRLRYYWDAENPSLMASLLRGESLVMRGAYFYDGTRRGKDTLIEDYIHAGVTAADWSGDRVEREIRKYQEVRGLEAQVIAPSQVSAGFAIRFGFLEAGVSLSEVIPIPHAGLPDIPLKMPVVIVDVTLPLPPVSVIASIYDDTVINRLEWHRKLLSPGNGQGVDIAIRTWTTALLVASGMKLRFAMVEVDDRLKTDSSVERVYQRHRAELFKRVPEAATFLTTSKRSGT